jgi:membrane protein DedA with SNARE-associated domain
MDHLIETYGYVALFLIVAIGCAGIPLPSVAILTAAALYAGTTHHLNIWVVIAVATTGAIVGTQIGFWLGRRGGVHLLDRYGPRIGLTERRMQFGQYVFNKYAGRAVVLGRFLGPLRAWTGFLAGISGMSWRLFVCLSAISGVAWALVWGLGAYMVGTAVHQFSMPGGLVTWAILALAAFIYLRRLLKRLWAEAEAAMGTTTGETHEEAPG